MNNCETDHDKDERKKRGDDDMERFLQGLNALKLNLKEQSTKAKFWLEVAGLVGLVFYASVAALQWYAMRVSNETSREALVSVQRAFLSLEGYQAFPFSDPKSNISGVRLYPRIKNSGKTQAVDARYHVNCVISPLPTYPDFDERGNKITDDEGIKGFYAPESTATAMVPCDISSTVPKTTYGWIKYHDVFDGTEEHITMFCNRLTIPNTRPPAGVVLWAPCEQHNCVDKQCSEQEH
jgi:hypothetical protein